MLARTAAQVRRLQMYKTRAVRNKKGKVLFEAFQSSALPSTRIQPDRRWFGELVRQSAPRSPICGKAGLARWHQSSTLPSMRIQRDRRKCGELPTQVKSSVLAAGWLAQ